MCWRSTLSRTFPPGPRHEAGKQVESAGVTIGECFSELAGEEEALCDIAFTADGASYSTVSLSGVPGMRAPNWSARAIGAHFVAVVPVGEGAAKMEIAEAIVPDELRDLGLPGNAEGCVGKGRKLRVRWFQRLRR
jgi:hypothetical protein